MRKATENASKARNARRKKNSAQDAAASTASSKNTADSDVDNQSIVSKGSLEEQQSVESAHSVLSAQSANDSDSELSIIKNLPKRGQKGAEDGTSAGADGDADSSNGWSNRKTITIGKQSDGVAKFQLEKCTELLFIGLSGDQRVVKLTKRITSYSELQQDVARYTPNSQQMFAIQDADKNTIFAKTFTSYDVIRVKEIAIKPDEQQLYSLRRNWEQEDYHEVKQTLEEKQLADESLAAAEEAARAKRLLQYY